MQKIEFTITGLGKLGSWTIRRFMTIDPEEDMRVTVNRLNDILSNKTEYVNWECMEWSYAVSGSGLTAGCYASRKWFDEVGICDCQTQYPTHTDENGINYCTGCRQETEILKPALK